MKSKISAAIIFFLLLFDFVQAGSPLRYLFYFVLFSEFFNYVLSQDLEYFVYVVPLFGTRLDEV